MIDFSKTLATGPGAAIVAPGGAGATDAPRVATQTTIPEQYQNWNPGAQYQITPQMWQDWGGGDTWQSGWYRHPNDPGHVVSSQDYGYQDWEDVFGGNQMTSNWDIARFSDRIPETQAQGQQGSSGNWQDLWNQYFGQQGQQGQQNTADTWQSFGQQGVQPGSWGRVGPGGINPEEYPSMSGPNDQRIGGGTGGGMGTYDWRQPLDMAQNTLGQFAGGMPYNTPWQWGQASDVASQFAEGGMPVDYQGWWDAQQPVLQRTIEDQAKQQAEQAGLAGSRWSTPLQRNISDIAGRETANTYGQFMGMSLQGQEAARQRQQQAVNQLQSLGQGNVGLENMMRQQQMQAAGMLPGLSQTGYGIQSDIARNLMQGGMGQQGMNQQALSNLLNIFGQQNPSLAMLLQGGIGGMGTPSNWAQQQYTQSPFSQFWNNMMPF